MSRYGTSVRASTYISCGDTIIKYILGCISPLGLDTTVPVWDAETGYVCSQPVINWQYLTFSTSYTPARSRSHDYRGKVKPWVYCCGCLSTIAAVFFFFWKISVKEVRHTYLCFTIIQCTASQPGLIHGVCILSRKELKSLTLFCCPFSRWIISCSPFIHGTGSSATAMNDISLSLVYVDGDGLINPALYAGRFHPYLLYSQTRSDKYYRPIGR